MTMAAASNSSAPPFGWLRSYVRPRPRQPQHCVAVEALSLPERRHLHRPEGRAGRQDDIADQLRFFRRDDGPQLVNPLN